MENSIEAKRIGGLQNFLDEIGAREINEVPGPNGSRLTFHAVANTVMIVQRWPNKTGGGFELFIPPSRSTDETFVAARRALDSEPVRRRRAE